MSWYNTGYAYKKGITIDHTKVSGTSNLSSFPILVSFTDANLKTTGNGGNVQNASGFDIIFTNQGESTQLDHEIESYTASSGLIIMWVRIPTLSYTADTLIYMYFGNASITTSQENVTSVWDANYMAVWHLKESAGTSGSIKDSTSNANHGTPYTTLATLTIGDISTASGQIGTAQSFNGSSRAITAPNTSSLNIFNQSTLTIECWVKRAANGTTGAVLQHGVGGVGGYELAVGVTPATTNQVKVTKFGVADITIGTFPGDTSWHLLHEVGDNAGTYAYVDGALSGTSGNTANWKTATATLNIGGLMATADNAAGYWNGTIDEIRISNIARSAGWIGTKYNNEFSPSTFYAVGALLTNVSRYIVGNRRTFASIQ